MCWGRDFSVKQPELIVISEIGVKSEIESGKVLFSPEPVSVLSIQGSDPDFSEIKVRLFFQNMCQVWILF